MSAIRGDIMHVRPTAVAVGAATMALCLLACSSPAEAEPASAQTTTQATRSSETGQTDGLTIIPSVVEPGDTVEIDTDACGLDSFAVAESRAFEDSISLEPVEEDFRLVGVGEIDRRARAGRHRVTVECAEGARVTGQLRVIPRGGPDTGGGGLATTDGLGQQPGAAPTGLAAGSDAGRAAGGSGRVPAGQWAALAALLSVGALVGGWVGLRSQARSQRRPSAS
ncbi:MAG: hypothetical protein L0Y54_03145 [Sporichthyaceae bacterium]|nr:hypothetical protein [Sporichthyaceae bacterium]